MVNVDQIFIRSIMLFEFDQNKTEMETYQKISSVYHQGIVSRTTVYSWYAKFRNGDRNLENKPLPGVASLVDNNKLQKLIEEYPRFTLSELATILNVSKATICRHMKQINKVWKRDSWVPHELNEQNKLDRVYLSIDNLHLLTQYNVFDYLITMDEKWVLYKNIKKGGSWQTKGKPGFKVARGKRFPKKVLISVFWDRYGVIYRDVLPNKKTVTAEYYQYQLCELYRQLILKRPWYFEGELPPQLFFHHDNASPHRAASTKDLLADLGFKVLPHPPYSPDLAPSDFHLFRSLQNYLNKQSFIDREQLIKSLDAYFNIQPQEFYRRGIYKMEERWILAINAWGEYFD